MFLISSAAYLNREFQVEFGAIPPAMLPLGNKRLFEYQVEAIKQTFPNMPIAISLPADFDLPEKDVEYFQQRDITIVYSLSDLSLGESILHFLCAMKAFYKPVRILYGDTYISTLPKAENIVGISEMQSDYVWENADVAGMPFVWCGFFSFRSPAELIRKLTMARGDFLSVVRELLNDRILRYEKVETWYDLGHINTYFHARSQITSHRSFNHLQINDGLVTKAGSHSDKILGEGLWFQNIPPALKKFTPQFIELHVDEDKKRHSYTIEYLTLPPLNEIFVHGKNSIRFWDKVFKESLTFLNCCRLALNGLSDKVHDFSSTKQDICIEKTMSRIRDFSKENKYDLKKAVVLNGKTHIGIQHLAEQCIERINDLETIPGVLHGDFCLSNILFDSRSQSIKVIDPRGVDSHGRPTIFGDLCYDFAKYTHSIIGLYDLIISGAYKLDIIDPYHIKFELIVDDHLREIQRLYLENFRPFGLLPVDIMPMVITLFLSMLPLHADSEKRQMALLANAYRLFDEYLS